MNHIVYQDCTDLQTARVEWDRGNRKRSLLQFERCVKRHPHNLRVLQEACQAFTAVYHLAKAHSCILKVLKLGARRNGDIIALAARMWQSSHRPEQALKCFIEATQAAQPSKQAYFDLAKIYERSGELDKAMECVEVALKTQPQAGDVLRLKGQLHSRNGEENKADECFSSIVLNSKNPTLIKAHALNSWAHLLDQQDQYDQAFEKLSASKSLLLAQPEVKNQRTKGDLDFKRLANLVQSLDSDHIASWLAEDRGREHFFLTGCPRSGTTLIEKMLDSHSGIVSADEYEALSSCVLPDLLAGHHDAHGYYNADHLSGLVSNDLEREGKRYLKCLELAIREKVGNRSFIDKNPGFTGLIPVFMRLLPKTRVLYSLRDPRDVALSGHFRWLNLIPSTISYLSAEESCQRTEQELNFWLKIRELLPSDAWKEIRYEDTVMNPEKETKSVVSWMNLEWEEGMSEYREHVKERGVNSPTYAEVSKPVYTSALDRWKNYEKHFGSSFDQLGDTLDAFNYT